MEKSKIKLPTWVYKNLEKFGNVALPYECLRLDKEELAKHLSKEVGVKVKIRVASFVNYESIRQVEKTFWVAEVE